MTTTSVFENDGRLYDSSKDMSAPEINTSRLQSSQSSVSSESDLSFSLSIERELDALVLGDELPAFEIRLISPLGRTPSPIDTNPEDLQTPTRATLFDDDSTPSACTSSDFVTLKEINAKISSPVDVENSKIDISLCNSLETIFEGVFLNTPPRKQSNVRNFNSTRGNLIEKMKCNRINSGKENQIPSPIGVTLISSPTTIGHTPSKSRVDANMQRNHV
ncbi:PREDICTED: uncharacterized protein LOC108378162 [Rhagoletis zephyria]|uniref:uncharacterized protein LOC108378162 n=1 Tax=Rhagoletis zephyria TaxID=28612 RepID=UPI000811244E|nr:PREDICTED: uncharacterized protein LOC108378162 [Rhagoletis zephyria]